MDILTAIFIVTGLVVFEVINSIDNAVINAEVLSSVGPKARQWFLTWGVFFAVFLVRGLLPLVIVWIALPNVSIWHAFTATFSNDPSVASAVHTAAPLLLLGAGVFLVFLFLHWLFLETKQFGLRMEKFFLENGIWFFAIAPYSSRASYGSHCDSIPCSHSQPRSVRVFFGLRRRSDQ